MPVIEELYAFVCEETPGEEGVCGANMNGQWMPMVGADLLRIESIRPLMKRLAEVSPGPIRLVRFSTREVLEEIEP